MTKVSLACNNCKSWHELTMIIMRNHYSLPINLIVALIVVGALKLPSHSCCATSLTRLAGWLRDSRSESSEAEQLKTFVKSSVEMSS